MPDWELITARTASDGGAVWYSPGERLYKRTGGPEVEEEGEHQRLLAALGFPVLRPVEVGADEKESYFTEPEAGEHSLHDLAMAQAENGGGAVDGTLVDAAAAISSRLLRAQAAHPLEGARAKVRAWFHRAGFVDEVFAENPDLDTEEIRAAVDTAVDRLAQVPLCHGHLDYGLPNAFPNAVIDWQHHAPAPLGYDVYPMLDIAAFKGGNRGYTFTSEQRSRYTGALDDVARQCTGGPLSPHAGDFLLAKCFFFLARMRPKDGASPAKYRKWHYRRALFIRSAEEYAGTRNIDTTGFPSLADFEHRSPGARP
ncbi:phosphotransferase [Nocardiopsis sp. CC223A]|uniref:phosphotransferase n=1 Tax=Nocardiopsis sp. CC223A TaxID=3044051 RepID=UPI00278C276F|nr:phosphotransferase [Nocardiopsis sp. CC223A]